MEKTKKILSKYFSFSLIFLLSQFNAYADTLDKTPTTTDIEDVQQKAETIEPVTKSNFIPDISLILDSSYNYHDIATDAIKELKTPYLASSEFQKNGFNFNYAELSLKSTVDPFFDLQGIFSLSSEGISVEEAFFNTRSLPWNLQMKFGKFRSSFGRLNGMHEHVWDFADAPLIYNAFFGSEQLNETGLNLNWIAPTDFFFSLGGEALQGENKESFGNNGFSIGKTKFNDTYFPTLFTGFAKTSFDISDLTILGGVSYIQGKRVIFNSDDPQNITAFDGNTRIIGADLLFKYFINSYSFLSLQTELLNRNISGNSYENDKILISQQIQSGLYSQLVWKIDELWRIGARYDLIYQNSALEDNKNINTISNLYRYSAMIDFTPSEFSRFRLQYNYDQSNLQNTNIKPINEIKLQMNLAIGAHGAHSF